MLRRITHLQLGMAIRPIVSGSRTHPTSLEPLDYSIAVGIGESDV